MRRHLYALAALLTLATVVQTLVTTRAVVPAQDAVRYVSLAQQIEAQGLREVYRDSDEALFPTVIAGVHRLRNWEPWLSVTGFQEPTWASSAQLAAALPAVLVVLPVYGLLTSWLGGRVALFGTIIFCLTPSVARLGADGLSDSTHLLLAFGCLAVVGAFLRRLTSRDQATSTLRLGDWALMGVGGLLWAGAVSLRPESLVLAPAIGVAVGMTVWRNHKGQMISSMAISVASFALAAGGVFVFSAMLSGNESAPLASVARMFSSSQAPKPDALDDDVADIWRLADGQPMAFPYKEHTTTSRFAGIVPACGELLSEIPQAFGWAMLPLAAVGAVWRRRRWRDPIDVLLWAVIAFTFVASTLYASSAGYLSSRHLLLGTLPVVGWTAWACLIASRWVISKWLLGSSVDGSSWSGIPRLVIRPSVVALLVGLAVCATIDVPLHASRVAHLRAAQWLNGADRVPGAILDTRGWTKLYSGRATYRYDDAPHALMDPELAYVVVEQRDLDFVSPRARTLREVLDRAAVREAVLPGPVGQPGKSVLVYRWDAARFSQSMADVLAN